MIEFAISLINQVGLVGAGLLIALEVIVPPVPSEAILLLTGFNVGLGSFSFLGALIATSIGSLAGATLFYLLGRWVSLERVEALVRKFGRFVGFPIRDLERTMAWFEKYGSPLVFFGRMFPIIRSVVSIPAGLVRMSVGKFYTFSTLGILIWNSIWIFVGMNLGENWQQGEEFAKVLDYLAYGLVAAIALYLITNIVRQLIRRR